MESTMSSVVKILAWISSMIVFVMMFFITADVILRYLFSRPILGTYQLAEFMVIGVVFLSITYVQTLRGHIKIEVATSWLPQKGQIALDILGYLIGIALFSVIAWQSGKIAWTAWQIKDVSMGMVKFPLWPAKALVPFGTGLLCLQLLFDLIRDLAKLLSPIEDKSIEREASS
jgi:TRAP-type C4-dicarboxylate transport system permease small subunit